MGYYVELEDFETDFLKELLNEHVAGQLACIGTALGEANIEHAQFHLGEAQLALELHHTMDEGRLAEPHAPAQPPAKPHAADPNAMKATPVGSGSLKLIPSQREA